MYSLVYQFFFWLKRKEKTKGSWKRGFKASQHPDRLCRVVLQHPGTPLDEKHPSRKYGLNRKPREQKVIVSFTSYPKRIKDVWLVAETLLRQSCKLDKVIL